MRPGSEDTLQYRKSPVNENVVVDGEAQIHETSRSTGLTECPGMGMHSQSYDLRTGLSPTVHHHEDHIDSELKIVHL